MRFFFLLFTLPLFAQPAPGVNLKLTPEPMALLKTLHIKEVGLWSVALCNDEAVAVSIAPERIAMAVSDVNLIPAGQALNLLEQKQGHNKKALIAGWIGDGLAVATMLTGFGPIAASKTVIATLGMSIPLAGYFQKKLEDQVPSIAVLSNDLLREPVPLLPMECKTKVAFAARMKNPHPVIAVVHP